ncbi:MAG: type II toxin-antitoxin system YafQ family toxin [Coriobacteriales bacterium]|nr:type II toxin-antitoxin system YafQ family toxin [Coriobacteriales bacterium]
MLQSDLTPQFVRDIKDCEKRHWNINALKAAMTALLESDEKPLDTRLKDHALTGGHKGQRALHIDSAPNPPRDKWVMLYEIRGNKVVFVRTGTHDDVY